MSALPLQDSPFIRHGDWGCFPGSVQQVKLAVFGFIFYLQAEELLEHVPKMFSKRPTINGPAKRTSFIGRPHQDGSWLFYPSDEALGAQSSFLIPDEASQAICIETFVGVFSAVYNRAYPFQSMVQVRNVYFLFRGFQAMQRLSRYMSDRFTRDNRPLFAEMVNNPVENILLAEDLCNEAMYHDCFIVLVGLIAREDDPALVGPDSVLSDITRIQLSNARFRILGKFNAIKDRITQLIGLIRGISLASAIDDPVVNRLFEFGQRSAIGRHGDPDYYLDLGYIIEKIETSDLLRRFPGDMRTELYFCKREINKMLGSKLRYCTEYSGILICMPPELYPWPPFRRV